MAGPQGVLVIEKAEQDAEATMVAVGTDDDARTSKAVDIIVGALKGAPPSPRSRAPPRRAYSAAVHPIAPRRERRAAAAFGGRPRLHARD